jgi:hypothetical protein
LAIKRPQLGDPRFRGCCSSPACTSEADFDQACQQLGIRHTRTKPRHCWTNGFVERLQGTILHEHWRVVFRRRCFTSRRQLRASLDGFLDFYNHRRPHRGYRLRGAVPGQLFRGVTAVH